jgi:hypothetical protein
MVHRNTYDFNNGGRYKQYDTFYLFMSPYFTEGIPASSKGVKCYPNFYRYMVHNGQIVFCLSSGFVDERHTYNAQIELDKGN